MIEKYTTSKYEYGGINWMLCKIFGHEKIIVNDHIDPDTLDRWCQICGRVWLYDENGNLMPKDEV